MALCERRPAEEHETDFIYALKKIGIYPYVSQIWGWDEAFQYREFEDDWAKRDEFWTLWSENEPVGYVQLAQEGHIVNVVELHIVPQHRRKGLGSEILQEIVENESAHGRKVQIGCFRQNESALRLYERLGFVRVGETSTHFILMQ